MSIAASVIGTVLLTSTAANAQVTGTTTNGSSWIAFAGDTVGWGATPIADNKGNVFSQIGTNVTASTFGVTGTLWYKSKGIGGASHTFTATPSSTDLVSMAILELTGEAANALDQFVTGFDKVGTPFISGTTAATTQANEIVIAFEFDNRSAVSGITWGNGYTSLVDLTNTSGITLSIAKLNVTATGTQQSSFTNANTTNAVSYIATFKELTAAGPIAVPMHYSRKLFFSV